MNSGFSFGTGIFGVFLTLCMYGGALAGETVCLTYGILAVIPAGPFDHQNLSLGISLIVLGGVGIAALGGAIAGLISGGIVCAPVCCLGCIDEV